MKRICKILEAKENAHIYLLKFSDISFIKKTAKMTLYNKNLLRKIFITVNNIVVGVNF